MHNFNLTFIGPNSRLNSQNHKELPLHWLSPGSRYALPGGALVSRHNPNSSYTHDKS